MTICSSDQSQLLTAIYPIILEKGLKATTMDLVAQRLGMSKRTLYEIFDSKNEMILRVLEHHTKITHQRAQQIYSTASDAMEALIKIFELHRQDMNGMNPSFFKDMDRLYPELRNDYNRRHEAHRKAMQSVYEEGCAQGVFRTDVNFTILSKMMEIQGESLKRMEELFPPEISMLEIYDTVIFGFLRVIASPKGNEVLDDYLAHRPSMPDQKRSTN